MLSFNDLLVLAGIDPVQVRLVRHQDNRLRPGRLYEAWRNDRRPAAMSERHDPARCWEQDCDPQHDRASHVRRGDNARALKLLALPDCIAM